MSAYGKRIERVGRPGAGQMMKMANQIAVGGALLALCESLAFAKRAGLDLAQTRELLARGAAGSWAFEVLPCWSLVGSSAAESSSRLPKWHVRCPVRSGFWVSGRSGGSWPSRVR